MKNEIKMSFRKSDQEVGSIKIVSSLEGEKSDEITWKIPNLYNASMANSTEKKFISQSFTVNDDDGITHTWFLALVLGSYKNGAAGYCLFPCFIPKNDCEEAFVKIELVFIDELKTKVWSRRFPEICRFNANDQNGSTGLDIRDREISSRVTACCKITQPHLHKFSLSRNLDNAFKNPNFTDVTLLSNDGKVFEAHKMILCARSSVFAAMFTHQMKENEQNEVGIVDMTGEVVEDMLRYIYTDRSEKLALLTTDLFVAADKYDLGGLKWMSEDALITNLSISNAVEMLLFSELHNATRLKTEVVKFITMKQNVEVFKTEAWKSLEEVNLLKEICEASANR